MQIKSLQYRLKYLQVNNIAYKIKEFNPLIYLKKWFIYGAICIIFLPKNTETENNYETKFNGTYFLLNNKL